MEKTNKRLGFMTTKGERGTYYLNIASTTLNIVLMGTFLTTYLTTRGIDLTVLGSVLLLLRIWDAINDAVFGFLADKIKLKTGRFKPYLKLGVFLAPISGILLFTIPVDISMNGKLIWYVVAVLIGDIIANFSLVGAGGIITTMTNNIDERLHIINKGQLVMGLVNNIGSMAVLLVLGLLPTTSFTTIAIGLIIAILLFGLPFAFKVKERVNVHSSTELAEDKKYTLKDSWQYISKNKYWLILTLSGLIQQCTYFLGGLMVILGIYLFGDFLALGLPAALIQIIMYIPIFLITPKLVKKFSKAKVLQTLNMLTGIVLIAMWFLGYASLPLFLLMIALITYPNMARYTIQGYMSPDVMEYGQYKTGIDGRGILLSAQAFVTKLAQGFSSSSAFILLGIFGWNTASASSIAEMSASAPQSPEALAGLWIVCTLLPGVGALIASIPFFFYKLKDSDVKTMAKFNNGEITREEAEGMLSRKY